MNNTTNIMLTTLLVMAHAIELTYELGKAAAPYIKQAVAFTITCVLYIIEAARYTYTHRQEILDSVGEHFVYVSPTRLTAPRYIRAARPANTLRCATC